MTPFPSFLPSQITNGPLPLGTFAFPTFGLGYDDSVVGANLLAVAVTDRPEVRQALVALASPDFGATSAPLPLPSILPANARFDVSTIANPHVRGIVEGLQAAIRSDSFRIDASDAMPPEIELAFRAGMMRLFREGSPENLDQLSLDIASEIEATWLDLESTD
jgi:hypothetical protein